MKKIVVWTIATLLATAPVAASAMTYSAVAISPNSGAYGQAHDFSTMSEAKSQALKFCRQYADDPSDCRVVTWSQGAYCASVASTSARDGSITWGSASGPTTAVANRTAFQMCAKQLGEECDKILVSVCSH